MPTSSESSADPWAATSAVSDAIGTDTRHGRADSPTGASVSITSASRTTTPSGATDGSGPLVGRIEQSSVTEQDIRLALTLLQTAALLLVAFSAYHDQ